MRYFFHLLENGNTIKDIEGAVFATAHAMRTEAESSARDLIANAIRFRTKSPHAMIVADDQDREVVYIKFSDLMPPFYKQ